MDLKNKSIIYLAQLFYYMIVQKIKFIQVG